MKKLAAIYDRGSTGSQRDNYSRVNAKDVGAQIAQREGYEFEYHKEIGSGASLQKRKVLMSILERVQNGEVHAIIVQDLDRLARPRNLADWGTIEVTCQDKNAPIWTHERRYDLNNPDDLLMARIKMGLASRERSAIDQRTMRGKVEKAKSGAFVGGRVALGYKLCFDLVEIDGKIKKISWLEIDENERPIVVALFDLFILHGSTRAARKLNEMGYRGKEGKLFTAAIVVRTIRNEKYAGYVRWGKRKKSRNLADFEPKAVYKPELQIVPLEVWERANAIADDRSRRQKKKGSWGVSPFSGLLACSKCGEIMFFNASWNRNKTSSYFYICANRQKYGKANCDGPTHRQDLIAKTIFPFVAGLLQKDLEAMLVDAASTHGTTTTEDELRRRLEAELHLTKEKKQRVVDSIADGTISKADAKKSMRDFNDQIEHLNRDLDNASEKLRIRADYLRAIQTLQGRDVEAFLWDMYQNDWPVLRQILGLIFEPVSITVKTYRVKGRQFDCDITGYEFTEAFKELGFVTNVNTSDTKPNLLLDISKLLLQEVIS